MPWPGTGPRRGHQSCAECHARCCMHVCPWLVHNAPPRAPPRSHQAEPTGSLQKDSVSCTPTAESVNMMSATSAFMPWNLAISRGSAESHTKDVMRDSWSGMPSLAATSHSCGSSSKQRQHEEQASGHARHLGINHMHGPSLAWARGCCIHGPCAIHITSCLSEPCTLHVDVQVQVLRT